MLIAFAARTDMEYCPFVRSATMSVIFFFIVFGVANVNGEFYAITDTCTHAGASMANGKIDGENIICGWHAASFECKSGKLAKFPAKIEDLKSYKVTVENGDVFVEV